MEFLPEVECDSQKFLGPPFLPFPLEVSVSVDEGFAWPHSPLLPPPPPVNPGDTTGRPFN